MQMVGTGPHVNRHQRPKVNNRKLIGIHWAARLLRNKVIHNAEKACGQEKAHCIVAVPPLHHGVHRAAIRRIGRHRAHRNGHAVDDMQYGNSDNKGTKEPVGHINV